MAKFLYVTTLVLAVACVAALTLLSARDRLPQPTTMQAEFAVMTWLDRLVATVLVVSLVALSYFIAELSGFLD